MSERQAVEWDYTALADSYAYRPSYAASAIDAILAASGAAPGMRVCDIGAGTGHLAVELLRRGLKVTAIEPNDAMRRVGVERTKHSDQIVWHSGTGEATGQPSGAFRLAMFGSSFNVVRQSEALVETHRVLEPGGWFACLWNHRDLADPLQQEIESAIRRVVPEYAYGSRREDPTAVISASGLFGPVLHADGSVRHTLPVRDFAAGWRSHATLQRQAGPRFNEALAAIDALLDLDSSGTIVVPYVTRAWMAQRQA